MLGSVIAFFIFLLWLYLHVQNCGGALPMFPVQMLLIQPSPEIPTLPHWFVESSLLSELPRDDAIQAIEEACPEGAQVGLIQGTFYTKNFVLLTSIDSIRDLYNQPENFLKVGASRTFFFLVGKSVLSTNGDEWRRHKGVLNMSLGQTKYGDIIEKTFGQLSDRFSSLLSDGITEISIYDWVDRAVFQTMGLFAYNVNYNTIAGSLDFYNLYHRMNKALRDLPKIFLMTNVDPEGLAKVLIKPLLGDREALHDHLAQIIRDDWIRCSEKGGVALFEARGDVLAKIVKNKNRLPTGYTEEDIIGLLLAMFLAAHETTAISISYSLYCLAKHPEYQQLVKEEIRKLRTTGQDLSSLTLRQLAVAFPTLHKVILEAWRLYPPAAGGFMRTAVTDEAMINGYVIPKGTIIIPSILSAHRSTDVWGPDAMEFRPERFHDSAAVRNLVTFGEGQHKCHGFLFAEIQTYHGIISLLEKFTFGLPVDDPNEEKILVHPRSPIMAPVDLRLTILPDY